MLVALDIELMNAYILDVVSVALISIVVILICELVTELNVKTLVMLEVWYCIDNIGRVNYEEDKVSIKANSFPLVIVLAIVSVKVVMLMLLEFA